jgi:hypothetical protein
MWGFGWMFWMVPLFFFMMFMRHSRRERWNMRHAGYGISRRDGGDARDLESQRSYVDALETRIAQLEERLDFTEKLVSGRRDG